MNSRLICFANSAISIEWTDDPSAGLVEFLFNSVPASGPAAPHIHFSLSYDPSTDTFHLTSNPAGDKKSAARGRMAHYLMERITYHLADRSNAGMLFHAACLAKDGAAILMPGNSGSGKSTLTVWFTQQGWRYLTDELSFLPDQTQTVQGLSRPIHLKGNAVAIFPNLDLTRAWPVRPENKDKTAWLIPPTLLNEPFRGKPDENEPTIRAILFPNYNQTEEFKFVRLSSADAVLRLTACLINARNLPDHGFPQVLQIARNVPAFSLSYNRFPNPAELPDLILT
jgi:hypothetical protein